MYYYYYKHNHNNEVHKVVPLIKKAICVWTNKLDKKDKKQKGGNMVPHHKKIWFHTTRKQVSKKKKQLSHTGMFLMTKASQKINK